MYLISYQYQVIRNAKQSYTYKCPLMLFTCAFNSLIYNLNTVVITESAILHFN